MIVFGTGASVGGPVSGWIADVTNWRWSFVLQVRYPTPVRGETRHAEATRHQLPFLLFSMLIVATYLPSSPPHRHGDTLKSSDTSLGRALADFDFFGMISLLVAISSLLLGLSNRTAFLYDWSDARVWALLFTSLLATAVFLLVEWKVAVNPVVPLQLFRGSRMASIYASNFMLSVAAQAFVSAMSVAAYLLTDQCF